MLINARRGARCGRAAPIVVSVHDGARFHFPAWGALAVQERAYRLNGFPAKTHSMATLAQRLGENSHCSILLRKARGLGINSYEDFVRLAVARGCSHYAGIYPEIENDPGLEIISNEELVALLLLGSNEFEAMAIRCAAQLAGGCDAKRLAHVARRERVSRPLAYIARAGSAHDSLRKDYWDQLLTLLGEQPPVADGLLPHWSRFVSQTGVTRNGGGNVQWLHCE